MKTRKGTADLEHVTQAKVGQTVPDVFLRSQLSLMPELKNGFAFVGLKFVSCLRSSGLHLVDTNKRTQLIVPLMSCVPFLFPLGTLCFGPQPAKSRIDVATSVFVPACGQGITGWKPMLLRSNSLDSAAKLRRLQRIICRSIEPNVSELVSSNPRQAT